MARRKNGDVASRLQYHNPHLTKVSTDGDDLRVEMVIAPHSLVRQTRAFVVCSRASASGCGCPKGLSLATEITACRGFTLSKNPIVEDVFDPWCATFKTSARRSLFDSTSRASASFSMSPVKRKLRAPNLIRKTSDSLLSDISGRSAKGERTSTRAPPMSIASPRLRLRVGAFAASAALSKALGGGSLRFGA